MRLLSITLLLLSLPIMAMAGMLVNQSLTLEQAKELALKNNPDYQAQKAALEAVTWNRRSALGNMLPSLSLSGNYLYMDPATEVKTGAQTITLNNDLRTIALSLSQPLFLGGRLWQSYKMGEISEQIARNNLKSKELSLLAEAENKYISLLQLQQLEKINQLELLSARQNETLAKIKYDNGLISQADYLRFQSRTAAREVTFLQAQNTLRIAQRDFMNYLKLEQAPVISEKNAGIDLSILETFPALDHSQADEIIRRALDYASGNNPSLAVLDRGLKLSQRAYSISKSSFLPTLMLTGSRQYKENGLDRYKFSPSDQIMLTLSLPILPQLSNYSASRKAYYELRKAEFDVQTAQSGIALGVESAVLNLISNAAQSKAAAMSVKLAEQSWQIQQERFRNNLLSISEIMEAGDALAVARVAYNSSAYSFLKSRAALMTALGTTDPQVLSIIGITASPATGGQR